MRVPRAAVALALVTAVIGQGCADASTSNALERSLPRPAILGWNLSTPDLVRTAGADGVTVAVLYGPPPAPDSPLGTALRAAHMRLVSAEISQRVADHECTRTWTIARPPANARVYCAADKNYSAEQLLADTANIARNDASNPLIAGHWILDDVAGWDTGGLRNLLEQIHDVLPPAQPTICGFSASIGGGVSAQWDSRRASNFTSRGCDAVAPYIYSTPVPSGGTATDIDWSMSMVLPVFLQDLRDREWSPKVTPLIGIGQAWAGQHEPDGAVEQAPAPTDMARQAQAYVDAGAMAIGWYAWSLSQYPQARTPANDDQLELGVKYGSVVMGRRMRSPSSRPIRRGGPAFNSVGNRTRPCRRRPIRRRTRRG